MDKLQPYDEVTLKVFIQNRVKIGAEFNQSCPRKASYKNKKWKQVINS